MKYSRTVLSEQRGVTFVEVLIVLAITSLIFAVSMTLLQNYVGQESFRSSVQLFTTELNGVINDVRTDIWPEVNEIKCKDNSGNLEYAEDPTALPGRNRDCIFIGKVIQLGVGDGTLTVSDESRDYIEHTLIGLDSVNEDSPIKFQVFQNEVIGNPNLTFDTSKARIVPHGGAITKVYQYLGIENNHKDETVLTNFIYLDGFAILLADFGEIEDTATGDVLGGARRISVWGIYEDTDKDSDTRLRKTVAALRSKTQNHDPAPKANEYYHEIRGKPIYICLDSGLGNQAFIRIGSSHGSITAVAEQGEAVKNTLCVP